MPLDFTPPLCLVTGLSAVEGVGFFAPAVPWEVLAACVGAAGLVVAAASAATARRAVRVSPITALQAA
ncbi:hypothetical protein [Georgenia sp. AZ-5]|uniref:hypothetical protein n=1 Tax=Georgenia sp. AZ-5 TaxID=3367526 RepID=UPI003754BDA6